MITDSILTDDTDLNQSAESTLQSPAFRRITISENDEYVAIVTVKCCYSYNMYFQSAHTNNSCFKQVSLKP